MKNLTTTLAIIGSLVSIAAHAQFGATSKADYAAKDGKQGIYGSFSPFARISGGGNEATGYLFSLEKELSANKMGSLVLGGWFGTFDSKSAYSIYGKQYTGADMGFQVGFLGGDLTNNKTDFSFAAFKELAPSTGNNPITASVLAGAYYSSDDKKFNFQAAIKGAYPLQNGLSVDAAFWYLGGSPSTTFITVGVGYRF
jgi:hypothetical protein